VKALASSFAVLALLAAVPAPEYQIDLARYFPSASTELGGRAAAIAGAQAFANAPTPVSAPALLHWLQQYDALLRSLERHDIYVYLKSEEDDRDVADAKADDALGEAEDLVTGRIVEAARQLGAARIAALTGAPSLAPYRYLLTDSLARAAHRLDPAEAKRVAAAVTPTLDAAAASYKALRKSSASIESNQNAYAALLVSIANARNALARQRGFATAAQAAYFDKSIDSASVDRALRAIRESGAYARYLVAAAKARKPGFAPPNLPISDALALILAAERRVNGQYGDAYAKLLDPAEKRLEICVASNCDDTGFSLGFAGVESGVYYGGYDGALRSVRAIAHESGHAAHREFMSLNQPIAAYNRGPAFMFESFAIFNELLFLDHLYQSAATRDARAYYLNEFLKDAAFQVFGSAEETELESSIYRGIDDRTVTTAADLNALSKRVFARYDGAAASDPATELSWARNRLFFTARSTT
jgi:oligoendopeptidase F